MERVGFFTRTDAKQAARKRPKVAKATVSKETLWKMGVKGVKGMNPHAKHRNIQPHGNPDARLYVLGEAPGGDEDDKGKNFVGKSGRFLRECIPKWVHRDILWDNVVRTRPPKNRDPNATEMECFRPSVEESIAKAKPDIILGVGAIAAKWALPGVGSIVAVRGRRIPIRVRGHTAWFYPVMHPAFLLRLGDERYKDVEGKEWTRYFKRDLARVARDLEDHPKPVVDDTSDSVVFKGVRTFEGRPGDLAKVLPILKGYLASNRLLACDLETEVLRPYHPDRKRILAWSFADGRTSLSVAFDHPGARWTRSERKRLTEHVRALYTHDKRMAAHNTPFELEWIVDRFGMEVVDGTRWEDSMAAAYVLDEREGALSLNWMCLQEFGVPIKQLTKPGKWKKRLAEMPLDELLTYNALDSKYGRRLMIRLKDRLKDVGLYKTYRDRQLPRIATCVLAQREGIPVDRSQTKAFQTELKEELREIEIKIGERPEVKVYKRRKGSFSMRSHKDLVAVFRDTLGFEEGNKKGGGYTTDEGMLKKVKDKSKLARLMLQHRRADKLKSTYVDSFMPDAEHPLVWPDGKIHCQFKATKTRTTRLSSTEPNNQNWPKRKDRRVRKQIAAPPGHKLLACDAGQIEARVIGMHSKDRAFCKALRENFDVHQYWSERTAKLYPKALKRRGSMKKLRAAIKNEFVFPAFYWAQASSIARYLDIPRRIVDKLFGEFWDMFDGVKRWQGEMLDDYNRNGYVESLSGRRRHGPLSQNMVVNTPIQAAASDIVVAAMVDLSNTARWTDRPWLQPILNIHDDLTFCVPDKEIDTATEVVVESMLEHRWDWINVPLSVEVEVGQNWFEMKAVGVYRSDEV